MFHSGTLNSKINKLPDSLTVYEGEGNTTEIVSGQLKGEGNTTEIISRTA